ncbi:hypothetical protein GDO81_022741 [Engystomops pustulosus]|uniref:SMG7 nonsense mediated mRNA decay factor n=1 Tax=Engystomops pustulosus TaxID=76066 RepID=A0AAV6Z471_ENGPU|nr:hypothetical protein GDO81_022741 [Engystomops pustulosus]
MHTEKLDAFVRSVWPWLISLLNSFHVLEEDLTSANLLPLPEEFELQGFLALRPAFRNLDFSRGHQAIIGDRETQHRRLRPIRLVSLGKWISENQPRLLQYQTVQGELYFSTDIPEVMIEDADDVEDVSSPLETRQTDVQKTEGSPGLKSVLSTGRSPNGESSEKPVVTFKENIKPQEVNREMPARSYTRSANAGKEQRDFIKGINMTANKKDNNIKRKNEPKKASTDKVQEPAKQSIAVQVKAPVSEARKTPVTPTSSPSTNTQFIPIHHPGAFPPLPSRPGFPPPTYVIPPVAFSMSSGYTFPPGVNVPGSFLQPSSHSAAGNQGPPGKQSHIPYSQQRPSGPGTPNQGGLGTQMQPQAQSGSPTQPSTPTSAQLQLQVMAQQQQQSPTKPIQSLGKNPQHHPSLQQYQQTADASKQLWNSPQVPNSLGKLLPPPMKQNYFMDGRLPNEPLNMLEQCLQHPVMQQPLEKKMKSFPMDAYNQNTSEMKMSDFYWGEQAPYSLNDNRALLAQQSMNNQRGKRQPSGYRSGQEPMTRLPFEERFPGNSVFNDVYSKSPCSSTKSEVCPPIGQQETSLYSLFEGKPWSPSLPASSDHSTPASQSPHSSNPSSLPSSPPTHNHAAQPFSNFGPIGTPDNRDRRGADRWKTDKPAMGGFGLDYLSVASSSENSWRQINNSSSANAWTAQSNAREDSSALMESLKSIWSTTMMHPGPSALEQLLMQQKEKQQRGQGSLNPPH